jgi:hypothetical protein
MFKKSVSFIVAFLFPVVSSGQEGHLQEVASLRKDVAVEMQYLIAVPQEEPAAEGWPLMLFLHGLGECGNDINRVKKHGPPKLIENGTRFPFVVVSPQCLRGSRWEAWRLSVLLDEVIKRNDIDEDRCLYNGPEHERVWYMGSRGLFPRAICCNCTNMWWRKYARWKTLDQSSCVGISRRRR